MRKILRRDHDAFSILVRRHSAGFYACAYKICFDRWEAEDAVQDAFIKLWNNPKSWDPNKGSQFKTWFTRVVINATYDRLRRKKNHRPADEAPQSALIDPADNQDEALIQTDEQAALEKALKAIPERQREALVLCYSEGLKNKEAADIMDIGVKALESLLMRGKQSLRDILERNTGMEKKDKRYG